MKSKLAVAVMLLAFSSFVLAQTCGDGLCCSDYNQNIGTYGSATILDESGFNGHTGTGEHTLSIYGHQQTLRCAYTAGTWDPIHLIYNCITWAQATGGAWWGSDNGPLSDPTREHCYNVTTYENQNHGQATEFSCAAGGLGYTVLAAGASCTGNSANINWSSGLPGGCASFTTSAQNPSYQPQSQTLYAATPIAECPFSQAPNGTPLVIADPGSRFQSSFGSLQDGVQFGFGSDSEVLQFAWPKATSGVGFLVLPACQAGVCKVTNMKQHMFGNLTYQNFRVGPKLGGIQNLDGSWSPYLRNGFEALDYYDDPANGGNGNGLFDPGDSAWESMRVWYNTAHDGIYDPINKPGEIKTLDQLGIQSIDVVNYQSSPLADAHGNQQYFVGSVSASKAYQIYDVILVMH